MECRLMYVEEVNSSGTKIWRKLEEKVKKALAKYQVRVCQMAGNAVQEDTSKYIAYIMAYKSFCLNFSNIR